MNSERSIREKPVDSKRELRAYEPPRILSRERLESVAADCSTTGKANVMDCPQGPLNS